MTAASACLLLRGWRRRCLLPACLTVVAVLRAQAAALPGQVRRHGQKRVLRVDGGGQMVPQLPFLTGEKAPVRWVVSLDEVSAVDNLTRPLVGSDVWEEIAKSHEPATALEIRRTRTRPPLVDSPVTSTTPSHVSSTRNVLPCNTATVVPPDFVCPFVCPYLLEDNVIKHCHYRCVQEQECGKASFVTNGDSVADDVTMSCRRCKVPGCEECKGNGKDMCAKCYFGFSLDAETGKCTQSFALLILWALAGLLVGSLLIFFVLWYVDLYRRPEPNVEILTMADLHREDLKVRDETRVERPPLPPDIDHHNDLRAGGVGFCLFMDFQLFLLRWICVVILGWIILGVSVGSDVFTLGFKRSQNDVELCALMRAGRAARDKIATAKCIYCGALYLFTLSAALLFSYTQRRKFLEKDAENITLMDFAARISGLPREIGTSTLESEYEDFICQVLQVGRENFVGVSILWDLNAEKDLGKLIEAEESVRELRPGTKDLAPVGLPKPRGNGISDCLRKVYLYSERSLGLDKFLGVEYAKDEPQVQPGDTASQQAPQPTMVVNFEVEGRPAIEPAEQVLVKVPAVGKCYAIFSTQSARDAFLATVAQPSCPLFRGTHKIKARASGTEPDNVVWDAFSTHKFGFFQRVALGFAAILFAIILWCMLFYLPYAYYTYTVFSTTGEDVSTSAFIMFTILVLLGNQAMYQICAFVAEMVKPHLSDYIEVFYVLCYSVATLINMILDFAVLLLTCYLGMRARRVRGGDGTIVSEMTVEEIMESYPMQRYGGQMMFVYNVMGCFIAPFIFEPIATIWLPYHLGRLIVRAKAVPFRQAVMVLKPMPMDLGRYADHVINVSLTVFTLAFSSGWVLGSMVGLLASLLICFKLDKVRSTKYVEKFVYSTDAVDNVAHKLFVLPTGILAGILIYQLRVMRKFRLGKGWTCWLVVLAFGLHCYVHIQLLNVITNLATMVGSSAHSQVNMTYQEAQEGKCINWFNANKVHCLRQKHIQKVQNPITWLAPGEVRMDKTARLPEDLSKKSSSKGRGTG